MRAKRAFLTSFLISFGVMGSVLAAVWLALALRPQTVNDRAEKVPVAQPGPGDIKTLLVSVGDEPFYFLIKLNAIENKAGVVGISGRYTPDKVALRQVEALQGAGGAQKTLEQATGVKIDYYLSCTNNQLRVILSDFKEIELGDVGGAPEGLVGYLLASASRVDPDSLINGCERAGSLLDNRVGLSFMTLCVRQLVQDNLEDFGRYFSRGVRACYDGLNTNINTAELARIENIARFMARGQPEWKTQVVCAEDARAREKILWAMDMEG